MMPPPPKRPGDAPPPPSSSQDEDFPPSPREWAALRQSHERLLALLSYSHQLLWSSAGRDPAWRHLSHWTDFTGQSPDGTLPRDWMDAIHPEDHAHLRRVLEKAHAERVSFECQYRLRREDGRYFWMLGRGVPLLDADGSIREWVASSTDIHAWRQAEERARFLMRAGEVLSSSLDYDVTLAALARLVVPMHGDWCIVDVLDAEGGFSRAQVMAEPSVPEALVAEVRGLAPVPSPQPVYPPAVALVEGRASLVPDVSEELLRRVASGPEHLAAMRRIGIRSLITVPMSVHGRILGALTFLVTRPGRGYDEEDLRFAQELASRAALSVENARLYREAQEAIRLRDEFLSIASHELRTPLTPLSLKLQALGRAAEAQPEAPLAAQVRSHVDVGLRQVRHLTELMRDLLDVSSIVGGTFHLRRERVDLVAVVREVAGRLGSEAVRTQTPLLIDAEGAAVGHWDRSRLEQVVTNLVDNALKYGAGAPVYVGLQVEAGLVRLTVRDQGIGIAPELLGRIFDRYVRAVSERHYGGLGLGLYITRTIVEAEGGWVRVDSTPGQGATFTVELPLP
ncbi:sensor histidine kinase [Melittangium boletus]|uniref:sensor histidine kinase n=1 Tax=Melittangium boletus TaxID=83453 RepID=UPI003DA2AAC0